jgi:hypothetical protein
MLAPKIGFCVLIILLRCVVLLCYDGGSSVFDGVRSLLLL